MLNYTKLLAPQAYVRVTTVGLTDVDGYVICVILVALSLGALALSKAVLARGEFAALGRGRRDAAGGAGPARRAGGVGARRRCCWGRRCCRTWASLLLSVSEGVEPHRRCRAVYTLGNYDEILVRAPQFIAEHAALRAARRAARRGAGRGDRLAPAPRPGAGPAVARRDLDGAARHPGRGARGGLPARLRTAGACRGLGEPLTSTWLDPGDRLRGAAAALHGAGRLRGAPAAARPRSRRRRRTWAPPARAPSGASRCR